jgi:hypothetical protein
MQRFHQPQPLAFPERSFIVQHRENEGVVFEPVDGIEDLMSTAERQYHDMEAMTRGAVENWTLDTAEHVVEQNGHGVLRGQFLCYVMLCYANAAFYACLIAVCQCLFI